MPAFLLGVVGAGSHSGLADPAGNGVGRRVGVGRDDSDLRISVGRFTRFADARLLSGYIVRPGVAARPPGVHAPGGLGETDRADA